MSDSEKNDGVSNHKLAGKAGYVAVIALVTALFGDNLVDVVIEISNPDYMDAYNKRIKALEKKQEDLLITVHYLEHGIANAKMCLPMKLVSSHNEDDQFDEFDFE